MVRWLIFIFFMAFFRLFLINFVQIDSGKVSTKESDFTWVIKSQQKCSYVLGWLIFGNIVDNAFDPKNYIVTLSFLLGVYFVAGGIYMDIVGELTQPLKNSIIISKDSSMILYSGIEAFTMVQLFNWFPRKWRGTSIASA